MSRCAGAGREQSQAPNPIWPMEIFHTIDVMLSIQMRFGQRAGTFFSVSLNFSASLAKSASSMITARGLDAQSVIGGEEKLYCI